MPKNNDKAGNCGGRGMASLRKLLAFVVFLSASQSSSAGWTGFVGFASGEPDGAELAVGYRFEAPTKTALVLHPLQAVIFEGGAPEDFREETFSNGQNVCRDLSNGQFAEKSKCKPGVNFEYTPSAELVQKIWSGLYLGAGYRGGEEPGAYGLLQIRVLENAYIGLRGGPEYIGGGVGVGF